MFGYEGGHMFWGDGLVMLVFWLAVIMLIIWGLGGLFSRQSSPPSPYTPPTEDTAAILQRRYALGEISRDEYLAILKDLHLPTGGRS
ncbi:MAG: hypothetical protein BroJett018_21440 [Chloroflexota bacterium]|nr:hypothetical protein [Chloroflexota bacterium]GIK64350.1 MAG: hypothetical protein BroJett018_21440 [Chloroflexota bacterium]